MATEITIGGGTGESVLGHRVYTREFTVSGWTLRPEVHCLNASWCAAPSMPEATIYYRYGVGRMPGDSATGVYSRFDLPTPVEVKIEFDVYDLTNVNGPTKIKTWFGVAGSIVDQMDGAKVLDPADGVTEVPSGYQTFHCAGIAWLLDRQYITEAKWLDGGTVRTVGHAPPFGVNAGADVNDIYFSNADSALKWSTLWIVRYLLALMTTNSQYVWQIDSVRETLLPDWDGPTMEQHGFTISALLNRVLARQRGLGYSIEFATVPDPLDEEAPDLEYIELRPFTFVDVDLDVGGLSEIKANPTQIELTLLGDHTGGAVLITDAFSRYHRVRVVGARAQTVFSAGVATGPLTEGWSAGQQTAYLAGSPVDLGPLLDAQAQLNEVWRAFLPGVYRDFRIDAATWEWETHDNEIAIPKMDPDETLLAAGDPAQRDYTFCRGKPFLDRLPLLGGVDYTTGPLPTLPPLGLREYMVPFCVFENPKDSSKYVDSRDIIKSSNRSGYEGWDWSATVEVDPERTLALRLIVDGRAQHVITSGTSDLTIPTDVLQFQDHDWNYRWAVFTLAVEADHYCEWLETSAAPAADMDREKLINVGPDFRLDRAAIGTVLGVDNSGALIEHDGLGYLRDDRPQLETIAKRALAWYGAARKSIAFQTSWINDTLQVGDLITVVKDPSGDHTVNTPITSITISIPISGGEVSVPKMEYETSFAELDVIGGSI